MPPPVAESPIIRVERCYLRWLPQSLRVRVSSGRRRVRAALRRRPAAHRPAVNLARNGVAAPAPMTAAAAARPRSNEGQSVARCPKPQRRQQIGPRLLRPRLIALLWPVLFRQALPSAYALQPFMAALMAFRFLASVVSVKEVGRSSFINRTSSQPHLGRPILPAAVPERWLAPVRH